MAHITPHFRHPTPRNGADIVTVKELLGRSTIVVTMRYAHTNDETKTRAVMAIKGSGRVVTMIPKPRRIKQGCATRMWMIQAADDRVAQ